MRPSLYSDELAESICLELAEGRSLRRICRAPELPCPATVYNWLKVRAEFRQLYEIARMLGADTLAFEILEIADNCDAGDVQRARLRVKARQWYLSKLWPRKYGRAPN